MQTAEYEINGKYAGTDQKQQECIPFQFIYCHNLQQKYNPQSQHRFQYAEIRKENHPFMGDDRRIIRHLKNLQNTGQCAELIDKIHCPDPVRRNVQPGIDEPQTKRFGNQ